MTEPLSSLRAATRETSRKHVIRMRPPPDGVATWLENGEAGCGLDGEQSSQDKAMFDALSPGDAIILADDSGLATAVGAVKNQAAVNADHSGPPERSNALVPVDWVPLRPARTLSAPPIWMRRAIVPAPREMLDRCLTQKARTEVPDEIPFETILSGIGDVGLRLEDAIVRRYHVALKTRGFVILAGVSGTGKTWLAEAYANIVGARCLVEPVAPNWTTNEDLLGYLNPLDGVFHETRFTRFLMQAAEAHEAQGEGQPAQPFHVVLDEMNLARVEHYFARFLSAMEQRMRASIGVAKVPLCPGREVALTPNLRFIGTVNMDETTHGFADKVFDRAQLVELPVSREAIRLHLVGRPCADPLLMIWDAVAPAAPFAFRVLDDIDAYIRESEALGADRTVALDEQVLQKILPKIRGTDTAVGEALENLIRVCGDTLPLSRQRAGLMLQSARDHGFASFF